MLRICIVPEVWLWITWVLQIAVKHLHKSLAPSCSCQIMQTHSPRRLIPQEYKAKSQFFYTFECLSRSAWNYTSNWHAFSLPTGKDAFPRLGTLINWKLRQRVNTLRLSESWIPCTTSTASNKPEGVRYHSISSLTFYTENTTEQPSRVRLSLSFFYTSCKQKGRVITLFEPVTQTVLLPSAFPEPTQDCLKSGLFPNLERSCNRTASILQNKYEERAVY